MTLDEALTLVEASPDHRVLRRIKPAVDPIPDERLKNSRWALYVDCETTGLDHATAEVIEVAMVPFLFDGDGIVAQVLPAFHGYNEPKIPISREITKLTGITNDMVAGHHLNPDSMEEVAILIAGNVEVVIAHNAEFDRPFFEALGPSFAQRPWACSMSQVPWEENGITGRRLEYIAAAQGFFYDAHNAVSDCYAGIHALGQKLGDGRTALAHLLDRAFVDTRRIWALASEFEFKDVLKARGYRWNDGKDGRYKAWHKEVPIDEVEAETAYLRREIYRCGEDQPTGGRMSKVTPLTRFTVRG